MIIKDIDLEKSAFLTDLERNIFILPEEKLKDYKVSTEEAGQDEEIKEEYEHNTVFLFNGKDIYEVPCKTAARALVNKKLRTYLANYVFYKKWLDVKPEEIDMISLFLYDFIKAYKNRGENDDVIAYSSTIKAGGKATWAHSKKGAKGKRTSSSNRREELKSASGAQKELQKRVQKPVSTVVEDKVSLSKDSQKDNKFFEGFGKLDDMAKGFSDFAGIDSSNANSMKASTSMAGVVGETVNDLVTIGAHTVEGAVLGAASGAVAGAIGTSETGPGMVAGTAGGAEVGGIGGAVVGFALGVGEAFTHTGSQQSTFIDLSPGRR